MEIIPAIDVINGACVRLEKGDYSKQKTYHSDPLEIAREFELMGIKRLHLVDLDGAKSKQVVNLPVLQRIVDATQLQVDFGGGIKSKEQVEKAFQAGAHQVTAGSVAARQPDEVMDWMKTYGPQKIILGADVSDLQIMVSGWQEKSKWHIYDFLAEYQENGAKYVICTDISKDGMLAGPAFELYEDLMKRFPTYDFIASGGVSSLQDVQDLSSTGIYGAIIGKAIYEGKITLDQLSELC
jgi:phosphoribosylformimino-5-aminoimidazole carboxamide ribotide isomerase